MSSFKWKSSFYLYSFFKKIEPSFYYYHIMYGSCKQNSLIFMAWLLLNFKWQFKTLRNLAKHLYKTKDGFFASFQRFKCLFNINLLVWKENSHSRLATNTRGEKHSGTQERGAILRNKDKLGTESTSRQERLGTVRQEHWRTTVCQEHGAFRNTDKSGMKNSI